VEEKMGGLTNELLPLPKFAAKLGIGQATAHEYREAGMPAVQSGRYWYVPELSGIRWVRENSTDRTYHRLFIDSPPEPREAKDPGTGP